MAKRSIHHSLLPYCLVLLFLPLCFSYSCRGGLRNYMSGAGNSTWKLCLLQTRKQVLRFKIKGLIQEKRVGWLSMGFPQKNQKTIPSFVLKVTQSNSIVQVCLDGYCIMCICIYGLFNLGQGWYAQAN